METLQVGDTVRIKDGGWKGKIGTIKEIIQPQAHWHSVIMVNFNGRIEPIYTRHIVKIKPIVDVRYEFGKEAFDFINQNDKIKETKKEYDMLTRIRYKTVSPELMTSTKPVLVGDRMVNILINPTALSFTLQTVDSNEVINQGGATTINGLKKAVKEALKGMGVIFQAETRKKRGEEVTL